jgi:hypothetical protein
MAKKENAIYAPGELSRVREKLGVTDAGEAKRIAELLGGEVGTERNPEPEQPKGGKRPISGKGSGRKIDIASADQETVRYSRARASGPFPGDDPSITVKLGYGERIKIDQLAGQVIFEIKNPLQVLISIFSFFKEPVDYVNPRFVTVRMNEYYSKIEKLVTSARNLFPKNNSKRNNQLKRTSIFIYKILDVLRSWDIEKLASNIAELQSHPRSIKTTDFTEVLRGIYKPLFVLEDLSIESIKSAFKLVYKILYIESPMDAKEKYQDIIRIIVSSLSDIRRNVHYGLYPLVMKLISDRYIVYERLFIERRRRFMAFMNLSEAEKLNAADFRPQQIESIDVETLQKELSEESSGAEGAELSGEEGEKLEKKEDEDPNDPKVIERKAKEDIEKAELKAVEKGRTALEALFPKAGWEKLEEYPDLYPYFANLYSLRHGYELISPNDPLQQVAVFLNILDDLLIGMRNINFGAIIGPDGKPVSVSTELGGIINNWRQYIEDSFSRDYLPRLTEYCRMLENSKDARITPYAKKQMNELHWIKRLYFLPYYKFESLGPPPFPKQDIVSIYAEIRKLRKFLTVVAMGIESGMRSGGTAAKAPCAGINNPWEPYNFQVPNPISRRIDMKLPPDRRINATLVFFSLSVVTILDYIVNNENSWAYSSRPGPLFRSIRNEGISPLFGIDERLDADKIFKDSLKKK